MASLVMIRSAAQCASAAHFYASQVYVIARFVSLRAARGRRTVSARNSVERLLGADRICQIHCTDEDGVLLQDNKRLDMRAVKHTLDDIGWSGWLVIERSRDARDGRNVLKNFGSNTAYLKSIFQAS